MNQAPMLEIEGLVRRYGPHVVLDGISLSVAPGEVVCLIGPSGTGKSTMLRCVNGLDDIQGGTIRVNGMVVRAHTKSIIDVRKRIGMIFQSFNLYSHLTALQNVMLAPMVVHGEKRAPVEERARGILEKVRMSHRIGAYPSQLSGGEQQRVAIARALATNPALLMFDEPTSALDPEMVGEVLTVMKDLAREQRTMLIVTHEIRFAADVGTRMVFMDRGKIAETGDPREMLARPKTERARAFLQSVSTH